jgi:predicted PurR-regulated permease PerM
MAQYWFRPKNYGYGATPATWEGWAVTIAAAAVVAASVLVLELLAGRSDFVVWMVWALFIAVATWWFVQFCRRRTDGEWKWRWGDSSNKTEA